jgi:drug/metabolite transporter (DMT)-like permease
MFFECFIITIILGIVPVIERYIIHFIDVETYIVIYGCCFFSYVLAYHLFIGHDKFYEDLNTINEKRHLLILFLFSSFLIFIVTNYLNLTLLKQNAAYLITAITSSFPIFTALFGFVFLKESVSFTDFIGIMLMLLGVTILNSEEFTTHAKFLSFGYN